MRVRWGPLVMRGVSLVGTRASEVGNSNMPNRVLFFVKVGSGVTTCLGSGSEYLKHEVLPSDDRCP